MDRKLSSAIRELIRDYQRGMPPYHLRRKPPIEDEILLLVEQWEREHDTDTR